MGEYSIRVALLTPERSTMCDAILWRGKVDGDNIDSVNDVRQHIEPQSIITLYCIERQTNGNVSRMVRTLRFKHVSSPFEKSGADHRVDSFRHTWRAWRASLAATLRSLV